MSKNSKRMQTYWRPNFVKTSELPDIKVVRTGFAVNFVAVLLVFAIGAYLLQREYRAYVLGSTVAAMEETVRSATPANLNNLRLDKEFRDAAAHIAELEKFYATPLPVRDFLMGITRIRPGELIFDRLAVLENGGKVGNKKVVGYRIEITGFSRSLTEIDQFKGELFEWELLNPEGYALEIDETLRGRDPNTGVFPYTLRIDLSPAQAAPGKGA